MNITDALAWARATLNQRWRIVIPTVPLCEDNGKYFQAMDADCMETLAAEVERLRGLVKGGPCETCCKPRWVKQREEGWWYCDTVGQIVRTPRSAIGNGCYAWETK